MKKQRVTAMILTLALALGLGLSACETSPGTDGSPSNTPSGNGVSSPSSPSSPGGAESEAPVEYDYAKISFYWNASLKVLPLDSYPVKKALEEINVEYVPINPQSSAYESELMALISAGSTPDIIGVTPDIAINLYNEGLIIPLDDYLNEEYLPNVMKIVKNWDAYLPGLVFPDGHHYRIPNVPRTDGIPQIAHWIRKDWLEKIGKPVPTSFAELSDVLIAFAKAGSEVLNGDNVGIYPMRINTAYGLLKFFTQWGADDKWYKGADGLPEIGFASSRAKDCAAWLKNLTDNGVINRDLVNVSITDVMETIEAGVVGYDYGYSTWVNADMMKGEDLYPDAVWEPIPYLTSETLGGAYTDTRNTTVFTGLCYAISSDCRDVEAALRLLNWMADSPGLTEETPLAQGSVTDDMLKGSYWYSMGERGVFWELFNGYIIVNANGIHELSGFEEAFPGKAADFQQMNTDNEWTWASFRFENKYDHRWMGATERDQFFNYIRLNAKTGNDLPDSHPYKAYENKTMISDPRYNSFIPMIVPSHEVLARFIYDSILGNESIDAAYDKMMAAWNAAGYQEVRQIVKDANGW